MQSPVFRQLIQTLLLAAAPVSLQAGCGTCTNTDASPFAATATVRARVDSLTCESYCGTGSLICSVVIAGQAPLALDCNGQAPSMSLPPSLSLPIVKDDCGLICDTQAVSCSVSNEDYRYPGQNARQCSTTYSCPRPFGAIEGRRPADVQFGDCVADSDCGAFFAEAYQLEAASIAAFAILAEELRAHGAPAALIAAASKAERDEVRHAAMAAALTQRFSGVVHEPSVTRHPVRSLLAIALENSVEGCVREAFGAFVASWQGRYAQDDRVRLIMARVAQDEIEHAELAFAVDAWVLPQLTDAERDQVASARKHAMAELLAQAENPLPPSLITTAGLPPADAAQRFLQSHAQLCA